MKEKDKYKIIKFYQLKIIFLYKKKLKNKLTHKPSIQIEFRSFKTKNEKRTTRTIRISIHNSMPYDFLFQYLIFNSTIDKEFHKLKRALSSK